MIRWFLRLFHPAKPYITADGFAIANPFKLASRLKAYEAAQKALGDAYDAQLSAKARGDDRDLGRAYQDARAARTKMLKLELSQ